MDKDVSKENFLASEKPPAMAVNRKYHGSLPVLTLLYIKCLSLIGSFLKSEYRFSQ